MLKFDNGEYTIGGVPLTDISDIAGLPTYVYDSAIIEQQVSKMRSAFKSIPHRIMFACKALTNINILRLMRSLGAGLDTVSIQEVEMGLRA